MSSSVQQPELGQEPEGRFPANSHEPPAPEYLAVILESLQTMKDGNFSVRLPVTWTGLAGKIADNFNEIVATNEQMLLNIDMNGPKSAPNP